MNASSLAVEVLLAAFVASLWIGGQSGSNSGLSAAVQDKKKEVKKGMAVGTLTAKGKNFIEVKADGEEKARKYVLYQGGTRELFDAIKNVPIGSRVRVSWIFIERLRVIELEVLKSTTTDGS